MNFTHIQDFLIIYRERSISRAAEKLHVTQQTLSGRLGYLEKELGTPLFVRHVPLELTYGGRVFLGYARSLQETYEALQKEFQDLTGQEKGCLRLGIAYTRGRILLPPILQAFQKKYPAVTLEITEDTNEALVKRLQKGETDLIIAHLPGSIPGLAARPFYQEKVLLLLPKSLLAKTYGAEAVQRLTQLEQTQDPRLVKECPFLLNYPDDIAASLALAYLNKLRFTPKVQTQSHNMELLLELCVQGAGCCFCPDNLARGFLTPAQQDQLFFIDLGPALTCSLDLVWQDQAYQWSMLERFRETAQEVYPPLP